MKIFAVIGAITILILVLLAVLFFSKMSIKSNVSTQTVLDIDFGKGLVEVYPDGLFEQFTNNELLRIRDVVSALDIAAKDRRIKGIVANITGGPFPYANVQEIRDAVLRFRKSGKFTLAFAETFGEMSPGNSSYYLASAFDSISLQPSGSLGISGIILESPFLKGTLDKLDIKPQISGRKEYKTARNMFTEETFTAAHREVSESIVNSLLEKLISDVAFTRKLKEDSLRKLVSNGPFTAKQAIGTGLIDELEYRDQLYDRIRQRIGRKCSFLYLSKYIRSIRPERNRKNTIALIYGEGAIAQGQSRNSPMCGNTVMGSQTVATAFRAAVRDKSVGAIVFRINSPGGSHIASDVIWRETVQARKAGKPVIVTMGAVAGSGGYYVAMSANKIIAEPSTITGSIGVVGGKFASKGFFNKLGITFGHVATDSNATMWSSTMEYSKGQWALINGWLDTIYNDFVSKVAAGRNLPLQKVEDLAKGRIYTGAEALKLGLVDTLGGFTEAFLSAKSLMGIPVDQRVAIKIFPKERSFLQRFFSKGPKSSEDIEAETFIGNEIVLNSALSMFLPIFRRFLNEKGNLMMERVILH